MKSGLANKSAKRLPDDVLRDMMDFYDSMNESPCTNCGTNAAKKGMVNGRVHWRHTGTCGECRPMV